MTGEWNLEIVAFFMVIGAFMLFKIVTLSANLEDAQQYIASLETLRDNLIEEQPIEWKLVIIVLLTLIGAFILFKFVRLSARHDEAKRQIAFLTNKLNSCLFTRNNEAARLKIQNVDLRQTISDLIKRVKDTDSKLMKEYTYSVGINTNLANERLQTQAAKQEISNLQQTINDLTEKLTETEENLTRESKQSAGNLKMLINERQQSKEAKQALKKKCTEAKTEKDQFEKELAQLKKTKFLTIQAALDHLNKRAETISNQIPKIVRNTNRENYMSKFKKLKEENDRMMLDLKTVTFNTRLYQSDHDALLKAQEEADRRYSDSVKKMNRITADCKRLISEYNSSIPDRFLKTIADHTRDLDMLAKIDFKSDLTNDVAIEHKVLNGLLKEREMLESILRVEKCNNLQTENDKPNNLEYINNLNTSNTYHLMIYNMAEASDDLSDIISFQTFMQHATGKYIKCYGVDRFGAPKKTPRPAKITLSSLQDFEDVLNSKAEKEYSHIRIEKYLPNKNQGKTNVG